MAVIGYIQAATSYGGDGPSAWTNIFTIHDNTTSFSNVGLALGLSWRKYGTTGGGPANFSADEMHNARLAGNVSVNPSNNSITVSGLHLNIHTGSYTVTQPGTNIVGAKFTWWYIPTWSEYFSVTRPNNSPVGNTIWYDLYENHYPANHVAAASNFSGATDYMRAHESATGTIGRLWIRVQNIQNVPPSDYRPGQHLVSGTWQSHNRSGGAASVRSGGSWNTMRTVNGGAGQGDPPLIRTGGSWYNQRKIGANQ